MTTLIKLHVIAQFTSHVEEVWSFKIVLYIQILHDYVVNE